MPTVAPEDMIEPEAGVYDGLCAVNIHRAPSLVPAEVTGVFDPDTVHCLPDAVLRDFGTEYRSPTWLGCSRRAARRVANGCREVPSIPTRHGRNQCPTVAPTAATRAGSIVLLGDSGAVQTSTEKLRAIARSALWISRIRSIPIVQITLTTDQAEDPIPIGRYTFTALPAPSGESGREEWQPSPDTEEIRQHLLDIVRLPEEHADEGYHFHTRPAHIDALMQLLEWHDERLVPALEEIARRPEAKRVHADIEKTIRRVRERLGILSRARTAGDCLPGGRDGFLEALHDLELQRMDLDFIDWAVEFPDFAELLVPRGFVRPVLGACFCQSHVERQARQPADAPGAKAFAGSAAERSTRAGLAQFEPCAGPCGPLPNRDRIPSPSEQDSIARPDRRDGPSLRPDCPS